jgi:hypothetical protein
MADDYMTRREWTHAVTEEVRDSLNAAIRQLRGDLGAVLRGLDAKVEDAEKRLNDVPHVWMKLVPADDGAEEVRAVGRRLERALTRARVELFAMRAVSRAFDAALVNAANHALDLVLLLAPTASSAVGADDN